MMQSNSKITEAIKKNITVDSLRESNYQEKNINLLNKVKTPIILYMCYYHYYFYLFGINKNKDIIKRE